MASGGHDERGIGIGDELAYGSLADETFNP